MIEGYLDRLNALMGTMWFRLAAFWNAQKRNLPACLQSCSKRVLLAGTLPLLCNEALNEPATIDGLFHGLLIFLEYSYVCVGIA
jgi:hypothetical protein